MDRGTVSKQYQQWRIALEKMQSAIEILDRWKAPAHIAAHVDLAAHQLQEALQECLGAGQFDQIVTNAEPQ